MKELDKFKREVIRYADIILPYATIIFRDMEGHWLLDVYCNKENETLKQTVPTHAFNMSSDAQITKMAYDTVDWFKARKYCEIVDTKGWINYPNSPTKYNNKLILLC